MKDLIIRGGLDVLLAHPAVQLAACVGRPDADRGEEVVAAVQLRPGQEVSGADLVAFARDRMVSYEYPREVACWTPCR